MDDDSVSWPSYQRFLRKQHDGRMFDVFVHRVKDTVRHIVFDGLADIPQAGGPLRCAFPAWCSCCSLSPNRRA